MLKCLKKRRLETYLANERFGVTLIIMDLGHILRSIIHKKFGLMLRGKGLHKPEFAYDIVRIHSLWIHTDLTEFTSIVDRKAPLLRYIDFKSPPKAGVYITTGQFMNYHTFSNLNSDRCSIFFVCIHIDLKDTSGKKNPLYRSVSLVLL